MSPSDPARSLPRQTCSHLVAAIEEALHAIPAGPTLGEFGFAREDCALVHIDYFSGVEGAVVALAQALAEERGTTTSAIFEEFGNDVRPCDCVSCVGPEGAKAAREKHRAAYTNVKEWGVSDDA